jgi:hypothetical protein
MNNHGSQEVVSLCAICSATLKSNRAKTCSKACRNARYRKSSAYQNRLRKKREAHAVRYVAGYFARRSGQALNQDSYSGQVRAGLVSPRPGRDPQALNKALGVACV